jgi:hypothetical protein
LEKNLIGVDEDYAPLVESMVGYSHTAQEGQQRKVHTVEELIKAVVLRRSQDVIHSYSQGVIHNFGQGVIRSYGHGVIVYDPLVHYKALLIH